MKRLSYFCIAFVFFAAALFSKDSSVLETSIYNDLQSYYASGFYPGVVEKADLLKENYPQSSFSVRADYLKGKALIYLEEYEKACDTLKNLLRYSKNPFEIQVKANYELGIASQKIGDKVFVVYYLVEHIVSLYRCSKFWVGLHISCCHKLESLCIALSL